MIESCLHSEVDETDARNRENRERQLWGVKSYRCGALLALHSNQRSNYMTYFKALGLEGGIVCSLLVIFELLITCK